MNARLADRTARIATSPTMKVTATVDRLRREGVEVIDFGAGEPDFSTPRAINAAAHEAIDRDFTRYTATAQSLYLLCASLMVCSRRLQRNQGLDLCPASGRLNYRGIGLQGAVGTQDRRVDQARVLAEAVFLDLAEVAEPRAELPGHQCDATDGGEVSVQCLPGADERGLPAFDDLFGG